MGAHTMPYLVFETLDFVEAALLAIGVSAEDDLDVVACISRRIRSSTRWKSPTQGTKINRAAQGGGWWKTGAAAGGSDRARARARVWLPVAGCGRVRSLTFSPCGRSLLSTASDKGEVR